ncbi:hypothetical protein GJAV_G00252200 [Gymnothorax javanicus]|nr:hypothetical protein GJAV_G00252200 [Gymnothorax javanicus]
MFLLRIILLLNFFSRTTSKESARLVLSEKDITIRRYSLPGNNSRIELLQGLQKNSLFVGGRGRLWHIDFDRRERSMQVSFPDLKRKTSISETTAPCINEYHVTTLHRVNATLLSVCATNGKEPKCCFMSTETLGMKCSEYFKSDGIAPFNVSERAPSLYLEGDVYAAVNIDKKYHSKAIRRIGKNEDIWPEFDQKERRYVGLVLSGPREDPLQDKVYTFLIQKSPVGDLETSSWTSWVTQVCKVDRGGSKKFLQKAWTSRLSARLACGLRDGNRFFDHLLDVTVIHEASWSESRVYGLFKNRWDMRAVCVYTMADIDQVFKTSDFKDFSGAIPKPRPGEHCVEDSTKLQSNVLQLIKEHSDMKDRVWPHEGGGPLMISQHQYQHIQADRVRVGHQSHRHYNILYLSLESGSVHKVLELSGQSLIIAELQPFRNPTRIQKMLLQRQTRKLYVSSSSEVVEVDLEDCRSYGQTCQDCALARDPYCSWSGTCSATAVASEITQDLEHGDQSVCQQGASPLHRKSHAALDVSSTSSQGSVTDVPPASRYFLRCPVFSRHAEYSWLHNGKSRECLLDRGFCVLLIDSMTPDQDGSYECQSSEGGEVKIVVHYQLRTKSKAGGLSPSPLGLGFVLLVLAMVQ